MGKVARGGGSGQGRSPALAGGGKGKGKARVDQVVKVLSGKTVDDKQAKKKKRARPSGGASGEASGRPRPPPVPAGAGSAQLTARQLIRPSEQVTQQGRQWRHSAKLGMLCPSKILGRAHLHAARHPEGRADRMAERQASVAERQASAKRMR